MCSVARRYFFLCMILVMKFFFLKREGGHFVVKDAYGFPICYVRLIAGVSYWVLFRGSRFKPMSTLSKYYCGQPHRIHSRRRRAPLS